METLDQGGERRSLADRDQRDPSFTIPEEITVPLKVVLRKAASEETFSELSFRMPSAGDIKKISKKGDGVESGLFALYLLQKHKLTELDIERLNALDAEICLEALGPFLSLNKRSAVSPD
jgi:hypothetical protein